MSRRDAGSSAWSNKSCQKSSPKGSFSTKITSSQSVPSFCLLGSGLIVPKRKLKKTVEKAKIPINNNATNATPKILFLLIPAPNNSSLKSDIQFLKWSFFFFKKSLEY